MSQKENSRKIEGLFITLNVYIILKRVVRGGRFDYKESYNVRCKRDR